MPPPSITCDAARTFKVTRPATGIEPALLAEATNGRSKPVASSISATRTWCLSGADARCQAWLNACGTGISHGASANFWPRPVAMARPAVRAVKPLTMAAVFVLGRTSETVGLGASCWRAVPAGFLLSPPCPGTPETGMVTAGECTGALRVPCQDETAACSGLGILAPAYRQQSMVQMPMNEAAGHSCWCHIGYNAGEVKRGCGQPHPDPC